MVGGIMAQDDSQPAPEFSGLAAWLNSKPLHLSDLKGKIVLIDFWTYSCVNCIRTLPHLKEWHEKYKKYGFEIIGIHAFEFSFEKKTENVESAIKKFGITWPVCLDNNRVMWDAYENNYWPRKYLIDAKGAIRYDHIGEGGYGETEMAIVKLLEENGTKIEIGANKLGKSEGLGEIEKEIEKFLPRTPEIYAGYKFARQNLGNEGSFKINQIAEYSLPKEIEDDEFYLEGFWESQPELLRHAGNEKGKIVLRFVGREINIVAESLGNEGIDVEILLDGKPLNKENAGQNVEISNGKSLLHVKEAKMYNAVSGKGKYCIYTIEFIVNSPDFSWYAFTFG